MALSISADDRAFRDRVESGAIDPAAFDHRAHLRLAYVYLVGADEDSAFVSMRSAIRGLLHQHGIDAAKYHDTITRAWILAVRHFMELTPAASCADEFIDVNPDMLDAKIMLSHYSAELLFSAAARATFVEPDREPIPRYAKDNDRG